MEREYLEQESIRANSKQRKLSLGLFIFFACICAFLYFAVGNSIDLSKPDDKKLFVIFVAMACLMLFCTAVQLIMSILPAKNGRNLMLPLEENTKEAVAENIYRYIPNVFKDYETQHHIENFPYVLEKLYNENRGDFIRFYEEEKQKLQFPGK